MNKGFIIVLGLGIWYGLTFLGLQIDSAENGFSYADPLKDQQYTVTSEYGLRDLDGDGTYTMHYGIDLANSTVTDEVYVGDGIPIYATERGTITIADKDGLGSYGKYLQIEHTLTFDSLYAHMNSIVISNGDWVTKGQLLGYMGTTGDSTGYHLHFEMIENGEQKNPRKWVKFIDEK